MEISLENLYVDFGTLRVKGLKIAKLQNNDDNR